jgi:hypothetical protein
MEIRCNPEHKSLATGLDSYGLLWATYGLLDYKDPKKIG